MKKINYLLLLFLLGWINYSNAQSNNTSLDEKPNSIFFAPFNVFDFINPSLQIGYERMLSSKIAVQIEGAYILNHSVENYLIDLSNGIKDCEYSNSGFKIRGEFKYYYSKRNRIHPYVSGELFYLKNKSRILDTFIVSDTTFIYSTPRPPGQTLYNDFFTLDKQRIGLNLKFGIKLLAGEHLFFEPHVGLGIVYRISKHYDRENLNDELYGGFLSFSDKAGNMFIANLPFNLKFGFRFK